MESIFKWKIFLCCILIAVWVVLNLFGVFDPMDLKIWDSLQKFPSHNSKNAQAVIVQYDDKTEESLNSQLSKSDLSALITIIQKFNPKVISLNLVSLYSLLHRDSSLINELLFNRYTNISYGLSFSVPRQKKEELFNHNRLDLIKKKLPDANKLEVDLENYAPVDFYKPLYKNFSKSKSFGHLVYDNKPDGIVRRIPAFLPMDKKTILSLGIQSSLDFEDIDIKDVQVSKTNIEVNTNKPILLDKKGRLMINYGPYASKIEEVSMIDVLQSFKNGTKEAIDLNDLSGKIVIIGNSSARTGRYVSTPVDRYMPMLKVHAIVAENIISRTNIYPVGWVGLFTLSVIIVGITFVLSFLKNAYFSISAFGTFLALCIIIYYAYKNMYMYLPFFSFSFLFVVLFFTFFLLNYLFHLKAIRKELQQQEKFAVLGEASAKFSHEIKNPLNAIKIYNNLLQMEAGGESKQFTSIIDEEIERATTYLDKMKQATRNLLIEKKEFVVSECFEQTLETYSHNAQQRNIKFTSDISVDLRCYADSDLILQVVENLLNNSFDAVSENGFVEFSAKTVKGNKIAFTIKDNGAGFSPSLTGKIFDLYYSTKKSNGTGLGLNIVKNIVDAHGGRIEVKSKINNGSSFTIII